ncbi:ADP compounds hydrolase NudE [Erwinia sp. BNK-24-b]|uniref:ADP compounds hydrolase NudE n=1 Tax=unclassified Erwinia TaxID=2622719 RepID=UPI0039BF512E
MTGQLQKPKILNVETVARSRLFTVQAVDLLFSNGAQRVYERMKPTEHEAVMIVPIIDNHLILIREYAVGLESYELGFPKGLIDPGETPFEAANRELKEEAGFGARQLEQLGKLTLAPSYFSSKMNIVVAEDLYEESLEGDEPEPLPQIRWPLDNLMALLQEPDFREARNVSALFLVREWLVKQGRLSYQASAVE